MLAVNYDKKTTITNKSHYFGFDKGVDEVTRAVADNEPDESGLQQLLLGAQSCQHLIQESLTCHEL